MGAPFYSSWRGPGLTFGIGEVQGSLLEWFWLPFWTQSLQRFSFKRASRSHAKTGFFLCLEIAVLPACQLTLAPFSRKLGFSVLLKTRFYLHGSSFFNNSYFLVNFALFEGSLEIAVLPAWELHLGEVSPHIFRFFWYFKRSWKVNLLLYTFFLKIALLPAWQLNFPWK